MTIPTFHVEAKLHAFRKTQEGVVVSFVVSPVDMPSQLALDPLGTRYMLALAAIGDDERPIDSASPATAERAGAAVLGRVADPGASSPASQRGKDAYANATEAGKAITRAAILCGDRDFRIWLSGEDISVSAAAQMIREACGVDSRRDFGNNPEALRKFQAIDTEYKMSIGQMAEVRR